MMGKRSIIEGLDQKMTFYRNKNMPCLICMFPDSLKIALKMGNKFLSQLLLIQEGEIFRGWPMLTWMPGFWGLGGDFEADCLHVGRWMPGYWEGKQWIGKKYRGENRHAQHFARDLFFKTVKFLSPNLFSLCCILCAHYDGILSSQPCWSFVSVWKFHWRSFT